MATSFFRNLTQRYGSLDGSAIRASVARPWVQRLAPTELYTILFRYYLNNGLYDDLTLAYQYANITTEQMRELRNPAHRVVEFHTAKIWPGDLPDALPLIDLRPPQEKAIQQIWRWSNWALKKQLAIRQFATFGDLFIKIAEKPGEDGARKVFMQLIDPRYVTDFEVDALGHLTWIRIDVPQTDVQWETSLMGRGSWRRNDVYWTEVWEKHRVRIWKSSAGPATPVERLGSAGVQDGEVDQDHGLGFVPVVWAPFRDIGEARGLGAFTHALSKIDEVNRMATKLHALLFRHNDVTWVVSSNMMDPSGRPLPAPVIGNTARDVGGPADTFEVGGERMVRLPGMSKLDTLIPHIDYNAALSVLAAMLEDLTSDLPELNYYSTRIKSNVSGVAMRFALADAIDRVLEARGNAEAALIRAHQMALTLGQRIGLLGFSPAEIGRYEAGDWEHRIAKRPVIQLSDGEYAQAVVAWVQAGVPFTTAARKAGWTSADIEQMRADQLAELDFQAKLAAKQQELATQAEEVKNALALKTQQQAQVQQTEAELAKQRQLLALQAEHEDRRTERQRAIAKQEREEALARAKQERDEHRQQAKEDQEEASQRELAMHRARLETQAEIDLKKQRALTRGRLPTRTKVRS